MTDPSHDTKSLSPDDTTVIGIDCATDPKKVGLAWGVLRGRQVRLREVTIGTIWPSIDERIASWITPRTLLALDAPLGWPAHLGPALYEHQAGDGFDHPPNTVFRRATDDAIAQRLGKRPLDVGADRIARTAHTALALLTRLRESLEMPIPLAWRPAPPTEASAIEVYPAGTLASRNLTSSGYKGSAPTATALRRELTDAVIRELPADTAARETMYQTDHALDAALCVLAGVDFIEGRAVPPDDLRLAKREGWIWVQDRERSLRTT